ncbi:MAG: glycoside hydrolase family 26 protein [Bacteroidales bacterium]|nr:glycoside hydrolase family 26 protein [Bacteroidales bacterium]
MRLLSSLLLPVILAMCSSCAKLPSPADKMATRETITLFRSLFNLQNKGVMYGHQDDQMYGRTWWYEKDRSDTKDFTGDYPAVAGFELGHLELGNERSLDSVSFAQIAEQIKVHYKRGGVVTISWHANNPLTMQDPDTTPRRQKGTAWDVSSKEVVASILPGGKNHDLFNTWLERLATFFTGLKNDNGTPVPFIFRPYHEHSGSFFWWGTNICTDEEYAALWRYTVEFLRDKKGLHNILYAYNTDRVTSLEQYMRGYPGDDIIDMLSLDMYDRGEQFKGELDTALNFVTREAFSRGKLTALSETGGRRGMADWWSSVLLPVVSKYPVGYVLTWRHTYRSGRFPGMPAPNQPFPDDFLNFYKSPRTLFLKEIQEENLYKR